MLPQAIIKANSDASLSHLVSAGAPETVVSTMLRLAGNVEVAEMGNLALYHMSCGICEHRNAILSAGAPAAIVAVIRCNHSEVVNIVSLGSKILRFIAFDSKENRLVIAGAGGNNFIGI